MIVFAGAFASLGHEDAVALRIVTQFAHEGLHEHDPPPRGFIEVLFGGGIGHLVGAEAVAFVLDFDGHTLGVDATPDVDLLLGVHTVPVLDRIHQRLFKRQPDAEDVAIGIIKLLEFFDDLFLDRQTRGGVAGNADPEMLAAVHNGQWLMKTIGTRPTLTT